MGKGGGREKAIFMIVLKRGGEIWGRGGASIAIPGVKTARLYNVSNILSGYWGGGEGGGSGGSPATGGRHQSLQRKGKALAINFTRQT